MKTLLTLLACVADGAIVGAVIGGLLGHWRKRRSALAHERERVRQRYVVLLNLGSSATRRPSSTRSNVYRYAGANSACHRHPSGAPFPGASVQRGGSSQKWLADADKRKGTPAPRDRHHQPHTNDRDGTASGGDCAHFGWSVAIVVPSAIIC